MAIAARPRGGPQRPVSPQPREEPRPVATPIPTPPIEIVGTHGVAPLMIGSLPLMASGNDVYARQFYRGPRLPFRRYLPVRSQ